jgi:di/tricarboxylate transporter
LIGQTVEDAGLRHLSGLYFAEIERDRDRIVPVRPTDRIVDGDVLVLFGIADTVVELRKIRGLVPLGEEDRAEHHDGLLDRQLFEVVVSANSPLIGVTLRDAGFRRRYDAAVIAIHRGGERLNVKLGDVELRTGDTLMLEASPGFGSAWGNSTDFYLVSQVEEAERPRYALANVSLLVLVGMVGLVTARILPMVLAAALAAMALITLRCIRPSAARKAIDLRVLIVIASSFGLSAAVVESGLAARTSELLLGLVGDQHPLVSIAALYIVTAILTEVVSNVAAAALVMPVAIAVAHQVAAANGMDIDPRPWAIAVAMAASMSFVTPLGYQTNLMVYGPGGYRFSDFARIGIPLAVVCFVTAMVAISAIVLPAI